MVRFIYACMALLLISFIGVPIYKGISDEHQKITTVADAQEAQTDDSLSFKEIYDLAAEDQNSDDPAFLNEILPAAGGSETTDNFSSGFTAREDSALADTPKEITEEEPQESASDL